jgi:hypothetical protein
MSLKSPLHQVVCPPRHYPSNSFGASGLGILGFARRIGVGAMCSIGIDLGSTMKLSR